MNLDFYGPPSRVGGMSWQKLILQDGGHRGSGYVITSSVLSFRRNVNNQEPTLGKKSENTRSYCSDIATFLAPSKGIICYSPKVNESAKDLPT